MTSCWINAEVVWDIHMATLRIPEYFLLPIFQALSKAGCDPQQSPAYMERVVRAILAVADRGKYHDAQVVRLHTPWAEPCWYVTILHPLLPGTSQEVELTVFDVSFAPDDEKVVLSTLEHLRREILSREEMERAVQAIVAGIGTEEEGG